MINDKRKAIYVDIGLTYKLIIIVEHITCFRRCKDDIITQIWMSDDDDSVNVKDPDRKIFNLLIQQLDFIDGSTP